MPLVYHYGRDWVKLAGKTGWKESLPRFIESAFDMIGCHRKPEDRLDDNAGGEPRAKKPRVFDVPVAWDHPADGSIPFEVLVDSELVVGWII